MQIARVTTAVVEANYDWTIVRVENDDGVSGWGEAFCAPGLSQTIRELAPLIEGRDARHVEPLVRRLHLATAHVSGGGTVYHAISSRVACPGWERRSRSSSNQRCTGLRRTRPKSSRPRRTRQERRRWQTEALPG